MAARDSFVDPGIWGDDDKRTASPWKTNSLGPVPVEPASHYKPATTSDPDDIAMSTGVQYVHRKDQLQENTRLVQQSAANWTEKANVDPRDSDRYPSGGDYSMPASVPSSMPEDVQTNYPPSGDVSQQQVASFPGLINEGNIDLKNRPRVRNPDGTTSTLRSISFEDDDGKEVLIPTVSHDGRIMSDKEAIQYYQDTGENLGKFRDAASATRAAIALHNDQARYLGEPSGDNDGIARAPSRTSQSNKPETPSEPQVISPKEFIESGGDLSKVAQTPTQMTSVDRGRADIKAVQEGRQPSEGGLSNLLEIIFTGKHNDELYGKR